MNFLTIWNLDAQNDFDKKIVTKKPVKENLSYIKYALVEIQEVLKKIAPKKLAYLMKHHTFLVAKI